MTGNAIEVDGVGKRYLLGEEPGGIRDLRDAFSARLGRLRGRSAPRDEIWALRDVGFEVPVGSALGVIGRNGAGKSTLLKILTRITEPTEGVSRTRGRVGSLLEVGTGFHPELTGRENVYLNGAILGMGRREIDRRLAEIVDFAGVERFMSTPVKRYSSGMYLRLAFSVAAHLDADILLVDEVLAVGDAEFQRRGLGRMSEVEHEGRTVVFVSHNLDAIVRLCPTAVWLDQGRVVRQGPSAAVVDAYLSTGARPAGERAFERAPDAPVEVLSLAVRNHAGHGTSVLRNDEPFSIEVVLDVREPLTGLNIAISLRNRRGVQVMDEALSDDPTTGFSGRGRYTATVTVPPVLNIGDLVVGLWVGTDYEELVWVDDALAVTLEGSTSERTERVLQLRLPWRVQRDHDGSDDDRDPVGP